MTATLDDLLLIPDRVDRLHISPSVAPADIRAHLRSRYDFSDRRPQAESVRDVIGMLERWSTHVTSRRYFGYFNPSVHASGIWADAIAAAFNSQLAVWSHSPAAVEIEQHTLAFLAQRLGFPPDSVHHFTSCGSEATHSAVIAALTARFPDYAARGLAGCGARPRAYASVEAHESIDKIAHATGLGRDAICRVATDDYARMSVTALEHAIVADRRAGWEPFMIIATAGTTAVGAIDPLARLASLCNANSLWLHVDGAWAASCVLSAELRPHVAGIELADSVTWDAHKWLSVPNAGGMFFCRRREPVLDAFRTSTHYMPGTTDGVVEPYLSSLQWSRRFIGLKLFLLLAEFGERGLADVLEHQAAMGALLKRELAAAGWVIVNNTPLPLVCFTRPEWADTDMAFTVAATVVARGNAWLSAIRLADGSSCLRACITSYRTSADDIRVLCDELDAVTRSA